MKELAARYLDIFPSERDRLRPLQDFLRQTVDPRQLFDRKNFTGHITASGFVLSPDNRKLALVKHKTLHRYLQPGGHVEASDQSVLAAARREIAEETGIQLCQYLPFDADPLLPIDIDTHEIPANPNKNEPKHLHHDFRYLFRVKDEVNPMDSSRQCESEWIWRPVEKAIDEPTFKLVFDKLTGFNGRTLDIRPHLAHCGL